MCFHLGKVMVPVDNRSVALGTCRLRLAQSLFLAFSRITPKTDPIGMGEALIVAFRPQQDDGAC